MPIEVKMAKLSPTMESGQMVKWMVKVGDKVNEGDTLAEIQTDKAVMPMESFDEGVVALLDVKEGEDIAIGQRILVLAKKGEDAQQVATQIGGGAGSAAAPPAGKAVESPAVGKNFDSQEQTNTPAKPESAHAGSNGQEEARTPEVSTAAGGRVKSTPLARKIAASAQVEIGSVKGSGPGGRVIRRDVEQHLERRGAAPPAPTQAPARPAAKVAPGETVRIPHTPMRKTIARRMMESKQAAPEIHVTVDVRLDKVAEIREVLNKQLAAEKVKLSVGDFVTRAAALALRKHPGVNASYEADAIVMHPEVNVGIAVAMDGGLMVPVLRNADTLGLRLTRTGTEEIVNATRKVSLKPNQMMGGTFTISNLGMYGVKQFDAIINQPE
ncbi:MAG: 2-oxo acid dehydrogenase subunit E2, partial [Planctomycetia bacterium]|nr:2-oxo acid dehydrogenase subunit E2 [Planctomycetia bacterium]